MSVRAGAAPDSDPVLRGRKRPAVAVTLSLSPSDRGCADPSHEHRGPDFRVFAQTITRRDLLMIFLTAPPPHVSSLPASPASGTAHAPGSYRRRASRSPLHLIIRAVIYRVATPRRRTSCSASCAALCRGWAPTTGGTAVHRLVALAYAYVADFMPRPFRGPPGPRRHHRGEPYSASTAARHSLQSRDVHHPFPLVDPRVPKPQFYVTSPSRTANAHRAARTCARSFLLGTVWFRARDD